jgi:GxxExxY protein
MKHEILTGRIIEVCFDVINELGEGFLESVYEKAILMALSQKEIVAQNQVPLQVKFRGEIVGNFFADLIVEDEVVVELKTVEKLHPSHQAQLINYLKATGKEAGLLVNFGKARLEIKRCHNSPS